jgi:hypothetical protein
MRVEINTTLWHEGEGVYMNRRWTNGTFGPIDPKTGVFVLTPTNFYPMLARVPSDGQVERMVSRYLTNVQCTCVQQMCAALPMLGLTPGHV